MKANFRNKRERDAAKTGAHDKQLEEITHDQRAKNLLISHHSTSLNLVVQEWGARIT
jgi:hypothetical protein